MHLFGTDVLLFCSLLTGNEEKKEEPSRGSKREPPKFDYTKPNCKFSGKVVW